VNALGVADVLAQLRDRLVGGYQAVEGIDAGMRRRGACAARRDINLDALTAGRSS
jgi:hypothetical protein